MAKTGARNPDEIDAALEKHGAGRILERPAIELTDLDARILWARAALSANNAQKMWYALQLLRDSSDALAIGVYAAIASQMHRADDVLTLEIPGRPVDRRELDGHAWLHLARSTALVDKGDDAAALLELGRGVALAELAGLPGRAQLIRLHARPIEIRLGLARPEVIQADLDEPMSVQRRMWHHNNYTAALLQVGEYGRAVRQGKPGSTYHTLALGLMGSGHSHRRGPKETSPHLVTGRNWARIWHGEKPADVYGLRNSLMAGYARLAYAAHLSRTAAGVRRLSSVLGNEQPLPPDQRAIWAAISLTAMARGGHIADPLGASDALTAALGRLDHKEDVLTLIRRLFPEAVAIGGSGPGADRDLQVAAIQVMSQSTPTPSEHVRAGYAQAEVPALPGRSANVGVVLAGIEILRETAGDQERDGVERHWQHAAEALVFDFGHQLPQLGHIYHCATDAPDRRLEA